MIRRYGRAVVVVLVVGTWLWATGAALASMQIQKKAKEAGFPAASCMYCHNEKLPKKGAATFNERGKWLQSEKDKRKAKEVDPAWLKDYVVAK
jgi:hypothetical protein